MTRIHGDEFAGGGVFTTEDGVAIWIQAERKRQDRKWGGWEHDKAHTANEWFGILEERLEKLSDAQLTGHHSDIRRRVIELSAVSTAYLEQIYDNNIQIFADGLKRKR